MTIPLRPADDVARTVLVPANTMYDLANFRIDDLERFSLRCRRTSAAVRTMDQAARQILGDLAANVVHDGHAAVVDAYVVKSHHFGGLDRRRREVARATIAARLGLHDVLLVCLAALSDGREQAVSPLPVDDDSSWAAAMLLSLGVDAAELAQKARIVRDRRLGVLHVSSGDGVGDRLARDDLAPPVGTACVLGTGALLPNGDLVALLLCLDVEVPRRTAELFGTAGVSLKAALTPFTYRVFDGSG